MVTFNSTPTIINFLLDSSYTNYISEYLVLCRQNLRNVIVIN